NLSSPKALCGTRPRLEDVPDEPEPAKPRRARLRAGGRGSRARGSPRRRGARARRPAPESAPARPRQARGASAAGARHGRGGAPLSGFASPSDLAERRVEAPEPLVALGVRLDPRCVGLDRLAQLDAG